MMFNTDTGSTAIAFDCTGYGSPVVALHASASSSVQWRALTARMTGRHCVTAPDLPGYGQSNALSRSGRQGLADVAAPIAVLIARRPGPVHLVGHSYGAAVAVKIALMRPDLVRSLVLYEPVLVHLLREGGRRDRALLRQIDLVGRRLAEAVAGRVPEAGMSQFIDFWNGDGAWARTPSEVRDLLTRQAGQVVHDFAAGLSETWVASRCQGITCPTLMLSGEKSPAVTRRVAEIVVENIPTARHEEIPDVGHMAPVTHGELIGELIEDRIWQVETRGRARRTVMMAAND